MRYVMSLVMAVMMFVLSGCASYVTPGRPADLSKIQDADIHSAMAVKPTVEFPTALAVVRLQGSGYTYHEYRSYGSGAYSVALSTDVETPEMLKNFEKWPKVEGVVRLNRMLLPENLQSMKDLRVAAAKLHAGMVLVYTFDTTFRDVTSYGEPLSVVTLGIAPNKHVKLTSTASAILIDTQTGYVYAVADAAGKSEQMANAWTTEEAVDHARCRAETEALNKLLVELEGTWKSVLVKYDKTSGAK